MKKKIVIVAVFVITATMAACGSLNRVSASALAKGDSDGIVQAL